MGSCSPVDVITKPRPQQEVCITWIFDSSYLPEEWTFKHQIFFCGIYGPRASNNCKKMRIFFSRGTYPLRVFYQKHAPENSIGTKLFITKKTAYSSEITTHMIVFAVHLIRISSKIVPESIPQRFHLKNKIKIK